MLRDRLSLYRDRVRRELTAAFEEEHTPHQVAASFAVGIFVTAMPTGGLGISLFFVFGYWFSWISKPAIFSTVAVLNPLVKPVVYVASFHVGALVMGTEVIVPDEPTLSASVAVGLQQLLVGNLLIAIALSLVSYGVVLHLTRSHRRRKAEAAGAGSSLVVSLFGRRR